MNITTSHGDILTIEDNEYLNFKSNNEEYKVLIKKISTIGDYLFDDIKRPTFFRNISLIPVLMFLIMGIGLMFDPVIVYRGTQYEEVNRLPDFFIWILFLLTLLNFVRFNNKVKQIKSIDIHKNDYELQISVITNNDPNRKEVLKYTICKGSFDELKEIKAQLENIRNKNLLV